MNSEFFCHCGEEFTFSDHCTNCGCEQFEGICNAMVEVNPS